MRRVSILRFSLHAQTYDVSALLKEGKKEMKSAWRSGLKERTLVLTRIYRIYETNYMRSQTLMQARSAL